MDGVSKAKQPFGETGTAAKVTAASSVNNRLMKTSSKFAQSQARSRPGSKFDCLDFTKDVAYSDSNSDEDPDVSLR